MNISELQNLVKYISNAQGEKTAVIIPIEVWNSLLQKITSVELYSTLSGLSSVDENEPKTQILADLQESIRAARAGETYPISQLWEDLDS
ncbi:hypothetical protein [Phormidium sp. CCY1219]|uniref:hypothetical protein n=1 Tax=Phormidium sp. CCY1219 TaxID=2886104 RepID=UPI002D1E885D|nr:hypothetical protein [Phormidium sp. CCY1219]MEB3826369.1 hypothetical protein [Phormidium sp. CCY1219]